LNVQKEVRLGNGTFTWKITDLERKANINTANEALLQQALLLMGVGPGDTSLIQGSILDWIDPDNSTHTQGAENDFYQSLRPSYDAKNGPIDDLSEMLLIKGVTPDLYWGINSTNHPPAAFQVRQGRLSPMEAMQAPAFTSGFVDLFTPVSSGRINVNTASADVLQLIPGVDRAVAEAIVAGREGEDDGSGLVGPYRNLQQVRRVPELGLALGNVLPQYCDVRSRTFHVEIDARVGNYARKFSAILVRNNPRDIQILTFYWH
jgi:general secretion pathway protein K